MERRGECQTGHRRLTGWLCRVIWTMRTTLVLLLLTLPAAGAYVEIGAGGNLLMNVPYCGG
jgi:hypothetical protein